MTAAEDSIWQIADHAAVARRGAVQLRVDLCQPADGLMLSGLSPVCQHAQLLGVVLAESTDQREPPADYFQRQRDLVVTYAANAARPTRVQVYWRQVPENVAGVAPAKLMAAAELQVSVQTDAMEIVPRVLTLSRFRIANPTRTLFAGESRLPATGADDDPLLRLSRPGGGCLIVCSLGSDHHYVEMVHPVDYQETSCNVDGDGELRISHQLLAGRLEKGVIVRARVRGLLLRGPFDGGSPAGAFAAFASAAPPLTV